MGFVNGYATEEDVKIELFLFEPEQISDLVIVPLTYKVGRYLAGLTYTSGDIYNNSANSYWINYPFAYNITNQSRIQPNPIQPLLFQRFNPYNKPFAEEYSLKLYNFLAQFLNDYINRASGRSRRKNHDYSSDTIPGEYNLLDLKDRDFVTRNISTPNNGLTIEYSYYYPEILADNPLISASWAKINYSNINNICLKNQESRRWLLSFNNKFCNGTTFNIRDDILNCSLVVNFIDKPGLDLYWSEEDKQFILNQIPYYYLYDNLDDFFAELTSDLLGQDPTLLNEIVYIKSIDYSFSHGWDDSVTINYNSEVYEEITLDIKPRLLLIANNNNWNNTYNWVGSDNKPTFNDENNLLFLEQSIERYFLQDENGSYQSGFHPYIYFNDFTNLQTNAASRLPRATIYNGSSLYVSYSSSKIDTYASGYRFYVYDTPADVLIYKEINGLPIGQKYKYIYTATGFPNQDQILFERPTYEFYINTYNWSYENNNYTVNLTRLDEFIIENEVDLIGKEINYYERTGSQYRVIGRDGSVTFLSITEYNNLKNNSIADLNANGLTSNSFNIEFIFNDLIQYTVTEDYINNINQIIIQAQENCYMASCDLEDLKKDVKEIHLALNAGKFAYLDGSDDESRVANIGYYVERIARILGISVNSDGSFRAIREAGLVESGDTIPSGWGLGQWARNNGDSEEGQKGGQPSEERDGLAWEIKSNKFVVDNFTGEPTGIAQGGYGLVENIPQLLTLILADLDRAFGLQDAGANAIPSPDGENIVTYQGLNTMIIDLLYMLSQISRNTSGSHICSLKNQAMLQEIFAALGQPTGIQEIEVSIANGQKLTLAVPGTIPGNPTISDMFMLILTNLGLLVGSNIDTKEKIENSTNTNSQ